MKCYICNKTPSDGTNLYRQNPKGETGIFACAKHSKPIDDGLVNIVANLQKNSNQNGFTK